MASLTAPEWLNRTEQNRTEQNRIMSHQKKIDESEIADCKGSAGVVGGGEEVCVVDAASHGVEQHPHRHGFGAVSARYPTCGLSGLFCVLAWTK